jgi:coenzyme F420-0:L-glutamate ligase/coenzyme F420-1:gamma-L-glutamate ligase
VALRGLESVGADVGSGDVRLSSDSLLSLGRAIARLEVALWGEGLAGELGAEPAAADAVDGVDGVEVQVRVRERAD